MREFRWFRASPLDAALLLPDGRTLGIIRQGPTAGRTAFVKRILRLRQESSTGALLVLASAPSRMEHARRLLDSIGLPAFLAVEAAAIPAGAFRPAWQSTSGGKTLSLHAALLQTATGGAIPVEEQRLRTSTPSAITLDALANDAAPDHLLPASLKPAEKRVLDLLATWPWIASAPLGALLGVRRARLAQIVQRLQRLGLVAAPLAGERQRSVLTDRGLALLARRDRTSVGDARRRWSPTPKDAHAPLTWRNVSGTRSRQLLRNIDHTDAVHAFIAALTVHARARGVEIVQIDPPHRASVFFRHDDRLHSVIPDASGVLRANGRQQHFFLEWERRAVRPITMAARIAPYLRYFSSATPAHGRATPSLLLVVFEDELTASHFLRVARQEIARTGVSVPLYASHRAPLEHHGPLGSIWRTPGGTNCVEMF